MVEKSQGKTGVVKAKVPPVVAEKGRYAVISISGAQELVREGDLLEVDRLEGEEGSEVGIRDVALVVGEGEPKIGTPAVPGAEVVLRVLEHSKGKKVEIRKFRAKSRYRRKMGHRQPLTKVRVEKIKLG